MHRLSRRNGTYTTPRLPIDQLVPSFRSGAARCAMRTRMPGSFLVSGATWSRCGPWARKAGRTVSGTYNSVFRDACGPRPSLHARPRPIFYFAPESMPAATLSCGRRVERIVVVWAGITLGLQLPVSQAHPTNVAVTSPVKFPSSLTRAESRIVAGPSRSPPADRRTVTSITTVQLHASVGASVVGLP